jgi:hypothetical protein
VDFVDEGHFENLGCQLLLLKRGSGIESEADGNAGITPKAVSPLKTRSCDSSHPVRINWPISIGASPLETTGSPTVQLSH